MCDYICSNNNTKESAIRKDNDKTEQPNEHNNEKVRIAENSFVLTLPRVELDEGELEDFKSHAKESGMNLEEVETRCLPRTTYLVANKPLFDCLALGKALRAGGRPFWSIVL